MRRLAVLSLLALTAAGCGGGSSKPRTATIVGGFQVLQVIPVHAGDSSLTPASIAIDRHGYYGIEAVNDGTAARGLELKGHGIDRPIGPIAPGKSTKVAVDFQHSGEYTLSSPGAKGLTATITVH